MYKILVCALIITIILYSSESSIESRIFNGNFASEKQFPFQVYLNFNNRFICGGSIYNENYIITAAHCVTDDNGKSLPINNFTITAGTTKLNDQSARKLNIERILIHNRYRPRRNPISTNDIALLKLQTQLQFSDQIKPIELYNGRELTKGESVIVSGWGRTSSTINAVSNDLRYTEMRTITPRQCFFVTGIYSRDLLCLSSRGIGTSTCSGDSGGPAIYNGKLVGITSFAGSQCQSTSRIGGFTRVSYFRNWIRQNAV